jgi:hypothetical protein
MFKLIILIAVVALILFAVLVLSKLVRLGSWKIRQEPTPGGMRVCLVKPGKRASIIGTAEFGPDFDAEMSRLRAEAKVIRRDLVQGEKYLNS